MRRVAALFVTFVGLAVAAPGSALAGVQTLVFHSAPISIGPYAVVQGVQLVDHPNVDGYVVGINANVVDMQGNVEPYSRVMLHHIVFLKAGVRDYTCGELSAGGQRVPAERFYAAGEERLKLALPAGYGYPNSGKAPWALLAMLMNHRNAPETVQIEYTVRYSTGEPLVAVKPVWLDEHNCSADPIFDVPGTGKVFSTFTKSTEFTMPESGRFVAGGGHLHGGALRLELNDASCSTRLFTSEPTWGLPIVRPVMHEPGPLHMSSFSSPDGIPVSKGDRLRLNAVYDNSLPHTRAMGILILYFVPGEVSRCAAVPALAPDPESHPATPPRIVLPLLRNPRGPLARNIFGTSVGDYLYGTERVSIRRGTTFSWRFRGSLPHDVTIASGPVGFSSPWTQRGTFTHRFNRPGVYRLFCSLHPTRMTQIVTVR
jgi:plastocyanin